MNFRPLNPPGKGDRLKAGPIRDIAEAVEVLRKITGGPGVNVTLSESGVNIALDPSVVKFVSRFIVPALISEANGADPDDDPENVTYKARAIGEELELATARVPDFSLARIVDAKVIKAAVGDLCFFFRWTDDAGDPVVKLVVITEKAATTQCETGE